MRTSFTPVDTTLIPTGELASVAGTPFDFRTLTRHRRTHRRRARAAQRGQGLRPQLRADARRPPGLVPAAQRDRSADRPDARRRRRPSRECSSIPGTSSTAARGQGRTDAIGRRSGFCLETQHFPDSPNHANFPSTVLRPGEELTGRETVFRFGVDASSAATAMPSCWNRTCRRLQELVPEQDLIRKLARAQTRRSTARRGPRRPSNRTAGSKSGHRRP